MFWSSTKPKIDPAYELEQLKCELLTALGLLDNVIFEINNLNIQSTDELISRSGRVTALMIKAGVSCIQLNEVKTLTLINGFMSVSDLT